MNKVEINKDMRLSEHFKLAELCKTSYITADGNIPSHQAIENSVRIGWRISVIARIHCMETEVRSQETVEMTSPSSFLQGIGAKRLIAFVEVRRVRIILLGVQWISSVMALSR